VPGPHHCTAALLGERTGLIADADPRSELPRAVLREAPLGLPVVAGRAATVRLVVAPCIVAPLVPGRDIVSINDETSQ
jgi:hypothetical protein